MTKSSAWQVAKFKMQTNDIYIFFQFCFDFLHLSDTTVVNNYPAGH